MYCTFHNYVGHDDNTLRYRRRSVATLSCTVNQSCSKPKLTHCETLPVSLCEKGLKCFVSQRDFMTTLSIL
jgi:hypothetical protein